MYLDVFFVGNDTLQLNDRELLCFFLISRFKFLKDDMINENGYRMLSWVGPAMSYQPLGLSACSKPGFTVFHNYDVTDSEPKFKCV
jgi:hypothetical protein